MEISSNSFETNNDFYFYFVPLRPLCERKNIIVCKNSTIIREFDIAHFLFSK